MITGFQRQRQEAFYDLEASLVYTASCRPDRALHTLRICFKGKGKYACSVGAKTRRKTLPTVVNEQFLMGTEISKFVRLYLLLTEYSFWIFEQGLST